MLDELELMRLHIAALFTLDASGHLLCVNEPGNRPAPRVFLGRTPVGCVLRTRADVADTVAAAAGALGDTEPTRVPLAQRPHCGDAIRTLLARDAPVESVWSGPAYCIDTSTLADPANAVRITAANERLMEAFPDWRNEVPLRNPFVVVVEAGRAVALCCSVRITPGAHEAGVETLPDSRGRGYASSAVAAWGKAVAALGALPLYSTSTENAASQGVARRLRMRLFGLDYHIT